MDDHLFGGNPFRTADALAEVSVRRHGPAFLSRGGAVGRALSELAKGHTPENAAKIAAKWGKGHAAELRLSSEHTIDAAIRELPFLTRPNRLGNARHADLEILEGGRVADTVQVGVGGLPYLRKKAASSRAGQLVIPTEIKAALGSQRHAGRAPISDRVIFKQTTSKALSEAVATEDAQQILHREIIGTPALPDWMRVGVSVSSGCIAAADAFATGLLFEVVERLWRNRPFDASMIERAVLGGSRAGIRTALATYMQVEEFLSHARRAFNAKLLAKVASGVVWAGAIADVVVTTSVEVWRWLKNRISLEELLRRAGVHGAAAAGGALGAFAALAVLRGAPPWAQILGVIAAGWGGTKLGRLLGDSLLSPQWDPEPSS
jgi:hypothetical protein